MSGRTGLEIAVLGLAGRFPGAKDTEELWRNLAGGVESIVRFTDEELAAAGLPPEILGDPRHVPAGAVVDAPDLLDAEFFHLTPREAEVIDPQHRLFLECAWEALESAGYEPESCGRTVGVYAGVSLSTYALLNVGSHRGFESLGGLLGADKDHLTTLVSWKLNLGGPSLAVQTACSTSLVAVHLAVQALLNGECDMALAGGASIRFPQRAGYLWTEGGIVSPDGRCRAFDAEARGTVFGDGVGVVVLKRLEDALADRDPIRAVIKGSAVNNDGAGRVGYTAPNPEGQARVIRAAQRMAEVEPDSIGYVEAHGTGTALGDPIEVAALTEAFRAGTDRTGFCALGSVKTNLGHLNTAAGVTGLIKAVLVLENALIPPTLHFRRSNPRLDLPSTPFFVNAEPLEWPAGEEPRRAAVSSFGMGGTNAHVILEEAPEPEPVTASRPLQLLVLSARSAAALEAATDRLASYLESHPEADLADVAYTLHVGRRAFGHRRTVLAASREEALRVLQERNPQCVLTAAGGEHEQPVAFLFPGQGSQYVDMARGLYQAEPVFRAEVDRNAELLRPRLGFDLREVLFPEPGQAAGAAERLARTAVTQPALFTVEHALARLWMEWGLRPQGMIGHSIGEYVAACLAGVFTVEEALELVALRGRLIDGLPGGAMLAVPLPADQVEPLLGPGLALAAVNGPAFCVAAGSRDGVERLRREVAPLLADGLESRLLHTSHAFHSAAMDPILPAFTEAVGKIDLQPPSLPFVSNVTGRWITAEEATDPTYWARHIRQTVRFEEGLRTLSEAVPDSVFLEVGPGRTLATLARQHPALAGRPAFSSLRPPRDATPDQEVLLRTLGQLWQAGIPIDWPAFYAGERRRRLRLPTYPFERRRYWIAPRPEARPAAAAAAMAEAEAAPAVAAAVETAGGPPGHHPRPGLGTAYVPPRNAAERTIAAVWQDLFGLAEVGVEDDFFELGGHSLLVTRMAFRVREALGLDLPLQAFFEQRTVAGLAALVEGGPESGQETPAPPAPPSPIVAGPTTASGPLLPPSAISARGREPLHAVRHQQGPAAPAPERIPRRSDPAVAPLSFGQQRLWLLDQLAPGNPFYILAGAWRLTGGLDAGALGSALAEVIRRHESLRAGFAEAGGLPVQHIAPGLRFELPVADLRSVPAGMREAEAMRLASAHARRPFDLGRPPLLRTALLRTGATEHVLLYSLHHIVSDGWSIGVLMREVARLYAAFSQRAPSPLPELPLQYADFAAWQRGWLQGEVLAAQLAYWRERLAGAPATELPGDRPRPPVQTFRGATWRTVLAPQLSAALAAQARERGVSLFMALLVGFDALVGRFTGLMDVVVGTPIAGRARPELEGLIGFFVNTLVLRTDLSGDPTAAEALARVRETAVGAYTHQHLPFEYLVEKLQPQRDLSRNPLFQLMFNLLNAPLERVKAGDLALARVDLAGGAAPFDLQVYLTETEQGIATAWEYATDLFDAATVQRLARHFETLLAGLVAAAGARLSELPLLSPLERRQLLVEWNATGREIPAGCVHEWVAAQAARTPAAVAVECGGASLTYRELEQRAGALARRLRSLGVGPEVRVGVALDRSLEMVVALLAVLEAGGAYVPLDPAFPAERLAFMVEDSGAAAVLTQEAVRPRLPELGRARVLLLPAPEEAESAPGPLAGAGPDNAAYVIYTSGSTGWPKGVQVPHGALANFLAAMAGRPRVGAGDVLLAVTSLSFDIAGLELFLPLVVGGTVVIASREEASDGRRLAERIAGCGATVLQATPATWRLLLESGWPGRQGLRALCGGEALPPALAASLLPRVGALWNVYGPTETTVWSTAEEIRGEDAVTIGRPIANTTVYVLDAQGDPAPVGAAGELLLGGAGLARGYLGRPELTAERFVPDPFGPPGARLYRTGDLARYRADGRLECLGRIDHQVKVRGHRIELGEIEAALGRHPEVAAAVVVAREEAGGDRRLVAYVVPRTAGADLAPDLRAWVRQSLPESMVPSAWVQLDSLPLTPNGKVDRKALPAPAAAAPRATTAPRTPTEQVLASLWAGVLGVHAVGVEDSFFDLGGHSLLATQLVSRVREAFGVELPLRRVFESPTLAGLARVIEADAGHAGAAGEDPGIPPLTRVPRSGAIPLSFSQQRLWFLNRLEPESPAYNIPLAVRLLGTLDRESLARALGEVVHRHEALRTTFRAEGSEPVQEVHPPGPFGLATVDLAGLPAGRRGQQARWLAAGEARRPFALERGPLLRPLLLRLGDGEHVLLLTMHHIVSDGWSLGVLVRELTALYRAFGEGRPSPLPELPVQYADFASWQRAWLSGPVLEHRLAYWKGRLADAPAVLELPADRPRPVVQRFRGGRQGISLGPDLIRRLRLLGQERGATLFMGLLAAFVGLLRRSTGQEDVVVGAPIAGRQLVETEGLIGLFLNTLVLRTDLPGDPGFHELLDRAREVALAAYAHQDLPFEKLVDELDLPRDLSHTPLFQVLLVLQNAPMERVELPGLTLLPLGGVEGGTAKLDLAVNLTETDGGVAGIWIYNTDLFDAATMTRMRGHFERLLEGMTAHPERRLSELPLLSDPERQQLLEWNAGAAADPGERCLHEWIEAQARRTPQAMAVVYEGASLTYAELDAASEYLGRVLRGFGVGPEVRVGICVERSLEMMVGLLGILKAGGAYVPLDPSYPADRLAFMLEDSRQEGSVLLTQRRLLETLPAGPGRVICLDEPLPHLQDATLLDRREPVRPDHLAYMIYTSGSTGRPKGAMNTHRAIVNRLLWMQDAFRLGPDDRVVQKTPFSFDVSVWELFWPLLAGARLVIARPGGHQDAGYLARLIAEHGVTTVHFVPSMLQVFLDAPRLQGCRALRRVIASGEALPADLVRRFFDRLGGTGAGLHNLYGPTEAAVDVTAWACERGSRRSSVPIGRPIANTRIHLLDRRGSPVPIGVPGELYIGGVQVGRGYLGQPALTAEKFVPDSLGGEPGTRLYATGDLARYLPDGAIEFLGRIDHQVKIRGFRIELEEIAAALAGHPAVREAVVLAREGAAGRGMGDWRLVAYLVPEAGREIAPAELRAFLAGSLPEYMLPTHWVVLDAMPLTPSGKVDRRALPLEAAPASGSDGQVAPRNELERFLAALWQEFLGVEVGIHDDFFALGGNSITGAVLINRLQERLGEIVHVVVLFDAPTVEKMAAHLAHEHAGAVERLFGLDAARGLPTAGERPEGRVGAAEVARFRGLLASPALKPGPAARNRRAVFVLSPPRSGSTLLRVMLGGHPRLFAPPELELLGFGTLAERRAAFPGRDSFWLEGAIRAVMEVRRCGPDEARALMEEMEEAGLTTAELYGHLQGWLGERILVDKTPSYALDSAVLRRAEVVFDEPFYVHLIRHPYGMIHSFEEAKLDQLFFRREHPFSRRELAELVWLVSHENVTEFLAGIPARRQLWVRFEDLVADPEGALRGLCAALGLDFHPDMVDPYRDTSARMTDGLHAESRMLGDVKFHQHAGIDRDAAVRWRERFRDDSLGELTWEMAARLGYVREPASGRAVPPLVRADRQGTLPLSFAQQRLWFLDRLEPGSPAYNISAALRLVGRLDTAALAGALDEVVRRHEALRTTFAEEGGEPVQKIHPPRAADLRVVDLAGMPEPDRGQAAAALARTGLRQPFQLDRGPLLRALLLRLDEREHVLLFSVHHIVADGWSMGVLVREVGALYRARVLGQAASLSELPVQYADYAVWQRNWLRGETLDEQLAYWRERLAGAPALLRLPTDRPRPAVQRFRGERAEVRLPAGPSMELRVLAQRRGATPFMALLAAFAAVLRRHSGQDDVVVGTPVANRDRAELEGLIGLFVNTLPLRVEMAGDPAFAELLQRVRATAVGAYAHQGLPFEKVVVEIQPERDLSSSPVFQVMLTLQNVPGQALALPDLELRPFDAEVGTAKFDLTLDLFETPAGFAGGLEYNTDLFDRATVDRLLGHLGNLVAAAAAAPETGIADLLLLSPAERHQLAVEWSDTAAESPAGALVHELIARRAARTPDAAAVTFRDEVLTYGTLRAAAGRLARSLAGRGIGRESLVGLCMERSLDLPAALLGILEAGGTYVPMDPAYPEERLAYMLEDAGLALLLAGPGAPEGFCRRAAGLVPVLRCEEIGLEADGGPGDELRAPGDLHSLAYVLYTSGSTGRPKGVEIPHGALLSFLASMSERPGLGADDVLLAVTSLSFDIAGLELYLPLLAGARVDVASPAAVADGGLLLARLRESGATVLQATPATWRMLIDAGWEGDVGVRALCGGEALPERLAAELRARSGAVWNLYGPTETTIWSAVARVGEGGVTVGRPIANTRILLLDAGLRPVAAGVPGELWIGGRGLARGYRKRPDLTAERFVPDPFAGERGERMYRTGDLARFRPDGTIEVLGRLDHQVKVRGFRIELGEIEAALERHPAVARAVALAVADRLVAWLVPQGAAQPTVAELRSHAGETLPDYMIPSGLVWLAELPLTPNGKVDRGALARLEVPQEAAAGAGTEPRNPVEELLAGMWCELLGIERVGIHDDFFALGGHSLTATRLAARVRQGLGVELPLRRLFERPTVAGLADAVERLRAAGAGEVPPLVPVPRDGELPLSFSQQRVWVLDQLEAAGTAYHLGTAVRLRGGLDSRSLEWALGEVAGRHEVLRTTFASTQGRPRQVVRPRGGVPLPRVDLQGLPAALRESESRRVAGRVARLRFDLTRGPLLRAVLVVLGPEEHLLGLTLHHIVADGWSLGILVRETAALYQAQRAGAPSPLPRLPVQYADFAAWQRSWLQGEVLEAQLAYWRSQLAGLPPVLQLALDRPRRPGRAAPAGRRRAHLSPGLAEALRALGRQEQATPFMILLAGFATVLHRATGQRDLAVGTPIANRRQVELEGLIGFFANTLVLRADLAGDPGFRDLLARVRHTSLDAYTHQDLPFERLVEELQPERDLAVNPLFQVMFQMQNVPVAAVDLPGLALAPVDGERGAAMFDLVLAVVESGPRFAAVFEYDADLFEPATVERLAGHWVRLLAGAVAEPGRLLCELPLLAAAEMHQVSVEWSDSAALLAQGIRVHQLIERQVERTPDALAVSFQGHGITYRELDARAGRLAVRLARLGAGAEARIGVCLERSPAMVVALLAVWKTGAAYVPMDPSYPEERLAAMLDDGGIALLLADGATPAALARRAAAVIRIDREDVLESQAPAPAAALPPVAPGGPEQLAYVIYTSGSTGRPKGVEVPHGALVNFLLSMLERPGLAPEDVLLAVTSLSFDIAALELFLPLLAGARVEIAGREAAADGRRLLPLLQESGATVMQATPVTWSTLVEAGWEGGDGLRVFCGGEALPERLARELCGRSPAVWNLYGPTETTVWSAARRLRPGDRVLVGPPIANTGLYLLDAGLRPVSAGVPGELWIGEPSPGGGGLARGYRGRPDLTAERFVPNPFPVGPGARIYRTGDLARFRPDGAIEILGRLDHQVKVRGFRIELGEIEAALESEAAVERAVVTIQGEEGDKRLVAYLVPRGGDDSALSVTGVRESLAQRLPDFMVPSAWVLLETLPLTPNGKVDRRALPNPGGARPDRVAAYVAPRTALEDLLAGIWTEVLGVERVGVEDNFFALGGHSLLATRVLARVGETLEIEVPLRRLFESPTVAGLAAAMHRHAPAEDLEQAAQLVLELLQFSESEVEALLLQQAGGAEAARETP